MVDYGIDKADDAVQLLDLNSAMTVQESVGLSIREKVKQEMEEIVNSKPGWARYQTFTPD